MTQLAVDLPLTPRERLRWRRAIDAQLIDAIFGRVVRDEALAPPPRINQAVIAAIMTPGADFAETLPTV